jgi:hypothetical protein
MKESSIRKWKNNKNCTHRSSLVGIGFMVYKGWDDERLRDQEIGYIYILAIKRMFNQKKQMTVSELSWSL